MSPKSQKDFAIGLKSQKYANQNLVRNYRKLDMVQQAERVEACGTLFHSSSNSNKPYKINFCKDRLCCICAQNNSEKLSNRISKITTKLQFDYKFILVTLKVRTCAAEDLEKTISFLMYSYKKFTQISAIKHAFKGYFRALEITENSKCSDNIEYQPCIHCILAVRKSYFKSQNYLNHNKLIKYWRQACCIDYDPTIEVQVIKVTDNDKGKIKLTQAISKVSNTIKPEQFYINVSEYKAEYNVKYLSKALAQRRVFAFGGVFNLNENKKEQSS